MKLTLCLLCLLVALDGNRATAAEPAAQAKPNIIMVLIDDMGWADFSCFGNTEAKTPNIDRLAAEGIRFAQFYVNAPICSPSRVALTTGQYPQRWRITSYLADRGDNTRRGMAQWLDPQAPVLARMLRDGGYATGHFGKWHMGGQRNVGDAPLITAYGFDESLTNFEGLGPRLLPLCDSGKGEPKPHALGSDKLGRGPITWQDRSLITEGFTGAAIVFARKAAAANKPFYINLWPDDVHSPFFPPAERRNGGKRALYHAVLETMDKQLGVIFEFIRSDPKLRDNTLVLICSDNGHEPGAGSAGPLRGAKTTLYEGGIRSPLIVWGPKFIAAGTAGSRNSDSVFSAIDLAPSLLAIAGVAKPEGTVFDGEDLSATLLGRANTSRAAPICWRRPPDRKSWAQYKLGVQPDLAIRSGKWKLLCEYDGTKPELYDLLADPGEAANAVAQNPELVTRLSAEVLAWHKSLPADNGPQLGAAMAGAPKAAEGGSE
jgi:arylsulfatase A-like enzyme